MLTQGRKKREEGFNKIRMISALQKSRDFLGQRPKPATLRSEKLPFRDGGVRLQVQDIGSIEGNALQGA